MIFTTGWSAIVGLGGTVFVASMSQLTQFASLRRQDIEKLRIQRVDTLCDVSDAIAQLDNVQLMIFWAHQVNQSNATKDPDLDRRFFESFNEQVTDSNERANKVNATMRRARLIFAGDPMLTHQLEQLIPPLDNYRSKVRELNHLARQRKSPVAAENDINAALSTLHGLNRDLSTLGTERLSHQRLGMWGRIGHWRQVRAVKRLEAADGANAPETSAAD